MVEVRCAAGISAYLGVATRLPPPVVIKVFMSAGGGRPLDVQAEGGVLASRTCATGGVLASRTCATVLSICWTGVRGGDGNEFTNDGERRFPSAGRDVVGIDESIVWGRSSALIARLRCGSPAGRVGGPGEGGGGGEGVVVVVVEGVVVEEQSFQKGTWSSRKTKSQDGQSHLTR